MSENIGIHNHMAGVFKDIGRQMKCSKMKLEHIGDEIKSMSQKHELPPYAFPYAHPAAGRGDVGAEFRGDDGGCITVGIERMEDGMLALQMGRSGLGENCFTRGELAKVLELSGILFAANGKQLERTKI